MVAALQWIGTSPRKLLWTAAGKLAMGPDCCCGEPARCDEPFDVDCDEYLAEIASAGCIIIDPAVLVGDNCDFQAWLAATPLDVTLPAGWFDTENQCLTNTCPNMDNEVIVVEHDLLSFALDGALGWIYPHVGDPQDTWCGISLVRTLFVRIQCYDVAPEGEPEDLRCFIVVELFFRDAGSGQVPNSYVWKQQLTNKLDIENLDIDVPMFSKTEDDGEDSICQLTGTPSINVKTH
jgi:hypothetical protein